jgi:hypothetical protein
MRCRHPIEIAGCMTIILALVCFLVVGYFVPNPEAVVLDRLVSVLALLGVILFGLGHWVLRKLPS